MKNYIYIKSEKEMNHLLKQTNIINNYKKESKNFFEIVTHEDDISKNKIDSFLDEFIDSLNERDTLTVSELKILGSTSFKILERIKKATMKNIIVYLILEDLQFTKNDKSLISLVDSLYSFENSLIQKKITLSKETRLKNKTKIGRKSGKKTKSIFDKYKRKIMRLNKQGVPKTKILLEVQQEDESLKKTSPQALGQYIKRIEHQMKMQKKDKYKPTYELGVDKFNIKKKDTK